MANRSAIWRPNFLPGVSWLWAQGPPRSCAPASAEVAQLGPKLALGLIDEYRARVYG
jgi:hypothetical protein